MKKMYLLVFLMLLFITNTFAQNNCSTPYAMYASTTYFGFTITGTPNTDTTNNYGCLTTANNQTWLYFQACNSGSLNFQLSTSSSSVDVDFVAYGPLSSSSVCGLTSTDILDCSFSVSSIENINISSVIAGQYYKILIANTSNLPGSYTIQLVGGTASYDSACTCFGSQPQEICQVTTDVLLNKNIIVWEKDTTYTGNYIIEKETTTMGVYSTLAIVMNNDTSAYIDSISNPMIQSFKYRIQTSDTCGAGSTYFGNEHQTIHLLTSVSSSTGYPQLNWNAYSGFYYGTYYIFRGSSPATLTLYDSISASFNTYTDVMPISGMNYYSVSVLPAAPCQPSRAMNNYSFSNLSPVVFTGINEFEISQFAVGPNPVNDILNFSLGNEILYVTVDVMDIAGRIIFSKKYENVNQGTIDFKDASKGVYFMKISNEQGIVTKKIIKQ